MKNFLGMEIEGEICHGDKLVPQRPIEEFAPLMEAVLAEPIVLGLGWTQYTPYYNDGDTCVFGPGDIYIAIEGVAPQPDYYDYSWQEEDAEENNRHWLSAWDEEFEKLIGKLNREWITNPDGTRTWSWKGDPENVPNPSLFKAFHALTQAIGSRVFNHVLLDLFGDHATIIIDKAKNKAIISEYYHD